MPTAQPAIFAQGTRSHYHLEFDLLADVADDCSAAVCSAISGLREPAVTSGGLNLAIGFGASLWDRLAPGASPAGLRPFTAVGAAPATQHDVWVWLHGTGPDIVLDVARAVSAAFSEVAVLAAEQPCFVYRDSRDLTGFIDGTENPPVEEAPGVALIPDGQAGAGGSLALTMKWVHDLGAFHALDRVEQEAVFGRTKSDSVELDEATKPPTAHISRTVIEDEAGKELEIFRRSAPFGTVTENGLYFVAFSVELTRVDRMLSRMFGTSGDGIKDRLISYSTPVSGAYYFVPSLEDLAALG